MIQLVIAEGILLVAVLVFMPIYSYCVGKDRADTSTSLKGLNMPEGSIRGILALMIVGSFIIFLVLGPGVTEMKDYFDKVLTAFGTLTGAVIGFYFGNRGTAAPSAGRPNPGSPPTPNSTQPPGGTNQ